MSGHIEDAHSTGFRNKSDQKADVYIMVSMSMLTLVVKLSSICQDMSLHSKVYLSLGPNKHGLVTYIQVIVYIGNTLSWLIGG